MGIDRDLATVAEQAARAGATELESRFLSAGLVVETKSSGLDVVTEADRASERAIAAVIGRERPGDGFVGEEGTARPSTTGVTWVVDPLDSTANFARGIPHWSVSIAAQDESEVLVGVVACPTAREVFVASKGEGLRLNGERVPAREFNQSLERCLGLVGWGRTPGEGFESAVGQLVRRAGKLRGPGSPALGLAWTAAGRADFAYYDQGFFEWDIAAGLFMCRERGLRTRLANGADSNQLLVAPPELFPELEAVTFDAR